MRKIVIGNWKMHTNVAEASLLASRIHKELKDFSLVDIVLCPPNISLFPLKRELASFHGQPDMKLGVQNIYFTDEGAFTGEISANQVKDLVDYAIIGHSERRHLFGETDSDVAKKVQAVMRHKIKPIICVGETKHDRSEGHSKQVVLDQLNAALADITPAEIKNVIIAYEPVWAIGSGNFAKPDIVQEIIQLIRNTIAQNFGRMSATHLQILYGGSVDTQNAKTYLQLQGCDGLLVGGASTNYKEFSEIVRASA